MQLREELLEALQEAGSAAVPQALESSDVFSPDSFASGTEGEGEASNGDTPSKDVRHTASNPVSERAPNLQTPQRNPGIHPRNVYATEEPNFAALAAKDPKLKPHVIINDNQRGHIDFTDSDSCRPVFSPFPQTSPLTKAVQDDFESASRTAVEMATTALCISRELLLSQLTTPT